MRRAVCAKNILINLCNVSWQIYLQVKYDTILTRHISFHFVSFAVVFILYFFLCRLRRNDDTHFPGRRQNSGKVKISGGKTIKIMKTDRFHTVKVINFRFYFLDIDQDPKFFVGTKKKKRVYACMAERCVFIQPNGTYHDASSQPAKPATINISLTDSI